MHRTPSSTETVAATRLGALAALERMALLSAQPDAMPNEVRAGFARAPVRVPREASLVRGLGKRTESGAVFDALKCSAVRRGATGTRIRPRTCTVLALPVVPERGRKPSLRNHCSAVETADRTLSPQHARGQGRDGWLYPCCLQRVCRRARHARIDRPKGIAAASRSAAQLRSNLNAELRLSDHRARPVGSQLQLLPTFERELDTVHIGAIPSLAREGRYPVLEGVGVLPPPRALHAVALRPITRAA